MPRLVIYLIILVVCGCANIQQRAEYSDRPEDGKGYLVGSFINSYRESYARLSLEIENISTGRTFFIELQQPKNFREIDIIPVEPGTYKVSKLVELGGAIGIGDKTGITQPELAKPFIVEAAHIYYIGNFDGQSTHNINSIGAVGGFAWVSTSGTQSVIIKNIQNSAVVENIAKYYSDFSSLPLINVFTLNKSKQQGPSGGSH